MAVEIRHLRVLVAVADAGSMIRASERLGLTQPTVTRAIAELERQLGTALLDRAGRGAMPTAAGREFIATARRLIIAFDIAVNTPIQLPTLRIAYTWAGLIPALERLMRSWGNDSTRSRVELIRVDAPLSAMKTATADLALIRDWTAQPDYRHLKINTEQRVIAVSSDDPLANATSASFDDLATYGLVINTHGGTTPIDLWGNTHNRNRDRTTSDVEDWLTTIATTTGVFGITPSSTADFYRHPAVTYLPLRSAVPIDTFLVWRDDHNATVDMFTTYAQSFFEPVPQNG